MKESFKFEYKKTNMFHNIQPAGLSVYGERGLDGKNGTSGSTLYFVDYAEITDTIKKYLLGNIQKSYTLDGKNKSSREYQNNDLIICKLGQSVFNNVYKITKDTKSNTYDIEKVGYLNVKSNIKNIFDTISDIKLNKSENRETTCHVPVNRSYETQDASNFHYLNGRGEWSLSSTNYEDALRTLFGFSLHPTISITDKANAEAYNFFLKIYIKNTKSILGKNSISIRDGYTNANTSADKIRVEPITFDNDDINPGDNKMSGDNIITFDKIIEIPITKYYIGTQDDELIDTNYCEFFLSDMGCDKLHPSLNNYSSSFFDPYRNLGYLTLVIDSSNYYPFHAFDFFTHYNDTDHEYRINGQTMKDNYDDLILQNILNKESNAYYHYGDLIQGSSELIQYSKDSSISGEYCRINFRSGESAYFSGMLTNTYFPSDCFYLPSPYTKTLASLANSTFNQYVAAQRSLNYKNELQQDEHDDEYAAKRRQYVMEYVCSKMNDFIFNENNVFEVVCINKKSGRTVSKIYNLNQLQ